MIDDISVPDPPLVVPDPGPPLPLPIPAVSPVNNPLWSWGPSTKFMVGGDYDVGT